MKENSALNIKQQEAVNHQTGPLLIIAGAGTGKTKVLTCRIAELIKKGVRPENILAITFTNKASQEMRERVHALLKAEHLDSLPLLIRETPFIGTFHSLGVYLLREHGRHIGLKKNFSIKDRNDAVKLTKEALVSLGLDPKQYVPSKIHSIISKQKGSMVSISDYRENFSHVSFFEIISRIWEAYEKLLAQENSVDFDDLIVKPTRLLQSRNDVLEWCQNKWLYVHIDEYQDTNHAQYLLSKLIANKHKNICAVGDGDQNVYSWRGANIQNILNFEEDYSNAHTVLLEENYRSTRTILDTANLIIKKNKLRKKQKEKKYLCTEQMMNLEKHTLW